MVEEHDNDVEFVHGIKLKVDGKNYYLAGAPDGPDGATDIPGHYWVQVAKNRILGKHFNTGPFGAVSTHLEDCLNACVQGDDDGDTTIIPKNNKATTIEFSE